MPCCFPTCRSITYLLVDGGTVVPIPRLVDIEEHLDYVTNRVVPDLDIRHALEKLWSASAVPGTPTTAAQLECATCGIDLPEALRSLTDKAFMIVIQDFQDPYTLNVRQLMKCCVEEITPDGRLIPFCAYNSVGYREQVREQLSGVAVSTIVPNAGELAPVLLTTRYGSKTTASSARPTGRERDQHRERAAMNDRQGSPRGLTRVGDTAEDVKACCAAAYQSDAVALILGESYHPGGVTLTRRLADALDLRPGDRVVDVASGAGTTALLLAAEYNVLVDGIDLGPDSVAAAEARAAVAGLGHRVTFHLGDAERLPLGDASADAVICECALCTFPDKAAAVAEMARVLKPGGRVGLTDVTLDPHRLDPELASLAGWVACVADARPVLDYCGLLERAGLEVTLTEAHDEALAKMIDTIDARLVAYRMIDAPALAGIDIDAIRHRVAVAARAVADRTAGYALLVGRKRPD